MNAIFLLIDQILRIFIWVLVAQAVLSWLVAFNVVNVRNRFVYSVGRFLDRLTGPLLTPIRHYLPDTGGIDISPVVLILLAWFLRNLLLEIALS